MTSSYGRYVSKDELKLPWIRCLWCSYKDKIDFDLAQHMFEKHNGGEDAYDEALKHIKITRLERRQAQAHDPYAFMYPALEYRLDKAIKIAKERSHSREGKEKGGSRPNGP